jgi:hypothetical protein
MTWRAIAVVEALGMGEHGHAGFGLDALDQGLTAARNDEIDVAGGGQHGGDVAAVGGGRDLDRVFRDARDA